eukprot:tig00000443_g788.t1
MDRPAAPYRKEVAKASSTGHPRPASPCLRRRTTSGTCPRAQPGHQHRGRRAAPAGGRGPYGEYADLKGKPTEVNASLLEYPVNQPVSTVGVVQPWLATVAHTGAYADLSGKPTTWAWDSITGKPSTYPHASHRHTLSEISDWTAPDLSNITVDWETQVTGRPATFPPSTHSHNVDWETQVTGKPLTFPPSTHSHAEYSLTGHGHRNVNMDAYITHGTSFHSYAAYTEFNINSTYTVTFNITFGQAYDTGGGLGTPANPTPVINVTPSFDINPGGSTDVDFYGTNVTAVSHTGFTVKVRFQPRMTVTPTQIVQLFIHWTAIGKLLM